MADKKPAGSKDIAVHNADLGTESKVFVSSSFARTIQGSKNIEEFLMRLPGMYRDAG